MVSLKLHLGQMFSMLRSSHRMCSIKKLSLKNFAIFTGKHLCWSFFLIKLAWRHATLLKRDSNTKLKFFIKFLFFHQMIAIQKLWKMLFFISSEKLFSRYSHFCIFSLPFHIFQIQKGKWKWNNLWCHELACINLQL